MSTRQFPSIRHRIFAIGICIVALLPGSVAVPAQTPGSVDDYLGQAKPYEDKGDYAGAERVYRSGLSVFPNSLELMKRLGIILQTELRFQDSIDTFQAVLAKDPKYPEVNFYEGLSYYGLNQFDKAVDGFTRELQVNPSYRRAHYFDAQALQALNRNGEALIQYEALLKDNPKDARVLFQLARFHKAAAVQAVNQLSAADPDSELVHILKAESYADEDKYAEAIEEYNAVLAKKPDYPGVHFAIGEADWKNVHYAEAEKELRLALQEDPNHPMANYYLADILIKNEKSLEAIPMLQITIAANPQYMMGYFQLGKCFTAQGKLQDAVDVLLKAEQLDPDYKATHYQLAQLYGRLNETDKKQAEMEVFRKLYEKERAESLKRNQKSLGSADSTPAATATP